jgi:hypothetical protein
MDSNHRQLMLGSGRHIAVASAVNILLSYHTYNIKMWIGMRRKGSRQCFNDLNSAKLNIIKIYMYCTVTASVV